MTLLDLFKAIAFSFFSPALYRDIAQRWQGIGFPYLLTLQFVIITPAVLVIIYMINTLVSYDAPGATLARQVIMDVAAHSPAMIFEQEQLQPLANEPVVIDYEFDGEPVSLVMIDSRAGVSDMIARGAYVLFARDGVHFRISDAKTQHIDYSEFKLGERYVVDSTHAQALAQQAIDWFYSNKTILYAGFGFLGWAATMLMLFLYRALQALIFGGIGLLMASWFSLKLDYTRSTRLACVALTPGILIDLALTISTGERLGLLWFIAITTGYLAFAIRANRSAS